MEGNIFLVVTWIPLCLLMFSSSVAGVPMEAELRDYLFSNNNVLSRPVDKWDEPVKVSLDYSPLYFIGLNGAEQTLEMYGWLIVAWTARNLTWNREDFGDIEFILFNPQDLWYPDLGIINSVNHLYGDLFNFRDFFGRLYYDGHIWIVTAGSVHTTCIMDVTYFPFDEHVCHIEVDSWSSPISQILISGNRTTLTTDKLRPNEQWELMEHWIHTELTEVEDIKYQTLSFVFRLGRKSTYVIVNFLFPCMGMVIMELVVFWLPPESGEKISLAITLLLSQTVYQLIMQGDMPRSSDRVPLINMYMMITLVMSGLILLASSFVLTLHSRKKSDEIAAWQKRLVSWVPMSRRRRKIGHRRENGRELDRGSSRRRDSKCHCQGKLEYAEYKVLCKDDYATNDYTWEEISKGFDKIFFVLFSLLIGFTTIGYLTLSYFNNRKLDGPLGGYGYAYKAE